MNRITAAALAFAAVLVALGTWWFLNNFERVEEEIDAGYQGEARANPFLAAERLFTRLGAPSRTLPFGPSTLPPPDHALLLVSPVRSVSAEQAEAIVAWVHEGGRLVVALDDAPSLDPLLRHWGVTATDAVGPDEKPEVLQIPLRVRNPAGKPAPVKAEIPRGRRLATTRKDAEIEIRSDAGISFVRYAAGQGSVTFVADTTFLNNDGIGEHDHAALAWALVHGGSGDLPAGVWLTVRDSVPTLAQLLARHAWMALASGAVLIAAWLWAAGSRFGPRLPEPAHGRRSLLEHIEASGEFLWRTGRGWDLVQYARQALLHRVEVREPSWLRLPPHELAQRLAAGSGLPASRIDRALHGDVSITSDLVTALQTLETVRRTL
jgi:hypothetical protein